MEDLKEIIYLSNDDFKKIIEEGSLTVGDIVIEYDPNSAYVVPFEVDDALSLESTNPVQNKVVTERIGNCVSIYAGGNITNGIQKANVSAVYVYNNYNGGALRVFLAAKPTDPLAGRIVQRDSNGRVAATGANGVNDYVVTDSDLADSLEELDSKPANIQEWDETKEYKVGDIVRCKPGDFERFYTALVDNVGVQPTQWGDTTWTMKNSPMPYTATAFATNSSVTSGYIPFSNGKADNFYLKTLAQGVGSRVMDQPVIVMTEDGTGAILQNYAPSADNHLTNKLYVDETVEEAVETKMPYFTEWNAETTYKKGDIVYMKTNKVWWWLGDAQCYQYFVSKVDDNIGHQPNKNYENDYWSVELAPLASSVDFVGQAPDYVYGIGGTGLQKTYGAKRTNSLNSDGTFSTNKTPMVTDEKGNTFIGLNPTHDQHATPKKYVDDAIEAKGTSDYIAWTEGATQEITIASDNMQYYKNGAFLGSGGSHHGIEIAPKDVIDIYVDMSWGTNLFLFVNGTELEFEATHIKVVVFGWDTIEGVQIMTNGRKV